MLSCASVVSWTNRLPGPIRTAGLRGISLVRELTAAGRVLPRFQIIGGQKCGTSSLLDWLVAHPGVGAPSMKEVHYFDLQPDRSVGWYRSHFPLAASGLVSGEASPYYLHHPLAAQRMHALLPDVRLIALLRNPIDRAQSGYEHSVRFGHEEQDFATALALEDERIAGEAEKIVARPGYVSHAHRELSYRSKGIYVDQLLVWLDHYPSEQLLVLKSEDFFADPARIYDQVLVFLGLPAFRPANFEARNQGGYESSLDPALREELAAFYAPHNQRLYELIGRDLGWS